MVLRSLAAPVIAAAADDEPVQHMLVAELSWGWMMLDSDELTRQAPCSTLVG